MIVWILMLFFSGFMAAMHLRTMTAGAVTKADLVSLTVFGIIGLVSAVACYRTKCNHSESQWDKIVDQFVKSWDRLSLKITSGRWILTMVSAIAFGMFCYVTGDIILKMAEKLPDTTVVALFMFLANILQNVFKDYFNAADDDPPENGNGNGNGKPKPPVGPQGVS